MSLALRRVVGVDSERPACDAHTASETRRASARLTVSLLGVPKCAPKPSLAALEVTELALSACRFMSCCAAGDSSLSLSVSPFVSYGSMRIVCACVRSVAHSLRLPVAVGHVRLRACKHSARRARSGKRHESGYSIRFLPPMDRLRKLRAHRHDCHGRHLFRSTSRQLRFESCTSSEFRSILLHVP